MDPRRGRSADENLNSPLPHLIPINLETGQSRHILTAGAHHAHIPGHLDALAAKGFDDELCQRVVEAVQGGGPHGRPQEWRVEIGAVPLSG